MLVLRLITWLVLNEIWNLLDKGSHWEMLES